MQVDGFAWENLQDGSAVAWEGFAWKFLGRFLGLGSPGRLLGFECCIGSPQGSTRRRDCSVLAEHERLCGAVSHFTTLFSHSPHFSRLQKHRFPSPYLCALRGSWNLGLTCLRTAIWHPAADDASPVPEQKAFSGIAKLNRAMLNKSISSIN